MGSLFVVFEGIDGAGKSSQLRGLAERLEAKGFAVCRLVEPTQGPHGQEIRRRAQSGPALTPKEELDLFLKDRRENVAQNIEPALERGEVVLQDRYYFSTAAYQGARPELGLTPAEVIAMHEGWAPRPKCVLLFDLPVEVGLSRVRSRGASDAFEVQEFQERVRAHFLEMAAADSSVRVIDASAEPAAVRAAVWEAVDALILEART